MKEVNVSMRKLDIYGRRDAKRQVQTDPYLKELVENYEESISNLMKIIGQKDRQIDDLQMRLRQK